MEGFWTGWKQSRRKLMKIRTDYVSNSSSSSFVVVLPKNYNQDDFIDDVVRACSDDRDGGDYDDEFVDDLNRFNRRNLDFCMNSYELLFIGELEVEWVPEWGGFDTATAVTINSQLMRRRIRCHRFDETDDEYRKKVVANIMQFCNRENRDNLFSSDNCMGICEITMNTIMNTQDLLAEGKKLELPKWADLDALKKRIKDGDRIFCIEMNQGGDGQNIGSIYALNGWSSDFNKYANAPILCSWSS